jgi:hypothetical protein
MDKTDEKSLPSHVRATTPQDSISLAIQHRIGEQLRAMYGDLKAEPLPDRLLDLLKQLDQPRSDGGS